MELTTQQLAYLRLVYRLCGAKPGGCADSRAVATAIGATEDERMDIEDAWRLGPATSKLAAPLERSASPRVGGDLFSDTGPRNPRAPRRSCDHRAVPTSGGWDVRRRSSKKTSTT